MSWLSKGLKKLAKGAVKVAGTVLSATPAGMAVNAVTGGVIGKLTSGGGQSFAPARIDVPGNIDVGPFSVNLPGFGQPGMGITMPGRKRGRVQAGPRGECPKGYHLNKSATADGAPAKSFCVRNRHTNFANGRAARRAGRRLKGTVRVLRRSFTLVAAKAPKGKWIPKGGRKR